MLSGLALKQANSIHRYSTCNEKKGVFHSLTTANPTNELYPDMYNVTRLQKDKRGNSTVRNNDFYATWGTKCLSAIDGWYGMLGHEIWCEGMQRAPQEQSWLQRRALLPCIGTIVVKQGFNNNWHDNTTNTWIICVLAGVRQIGDVNIPVPEKISLFACTDCSILLLCIKIRDISIWKCSSNQPRNT